MMRYTRAWIIALAALALFAASCGSPTQPTSGWDLVWQDEFDGAAGTSPRSDRWAFDIGTNWGNDQLEYDTPRPQNASLDGMGHLAIVARQENYLSSSYTSARLTTRGIFEQVYGRFEARIRMPTGRGLWPAFWLLGSNINTVGWPACGEIDIVEYKGQEPSTIHGSLHGPGYSGGAALTQSHTSSAAFDADFHVFVVEWGVNDIRYLVDDTVYQTIAVTSLPAGRTWVFNHAFFLILNLAVGGTYVGSPDGTTQFPQTMLVDYVRVYRAAS